MDIKWNALGEVAAVSFAVGVTIVAIFAVGVLAWSHNGTPEPPHDEGRTRESTAAHVPGGLSLAASALCFLACALITAYGIYLIVPQFH